MFLHCDQFKFCFNFFFLKVLLFDHFAIVLVEELEV